MPFQLSKVTNLTPFIKFQAIRMDMKIDTIFLKRLFSISMIIILSIVTYNRLEKLLKEETGLTQTFTENGISLPSLTICVRDFDEELVRLQVI